MRRTSFHSARLTGLLAELTGAGPSSATTAAQGTFGERLGLWLDWTDAIALSAVLGQATPAAPATDPGAAADLPQAVARLRQDLTQAIATDPLLGADTATPAPTARRAGGSAAPSAVQTAAPNAAMAPAYASYRFSLSSHQRTMAARIPPLRARLRGALAGRGADGARLAALDATLEQALAGRERAALATVPGLLERRFQQLRRDAAAAPPPDTAATRTPPATAAPWLLQFGQELRAVLLAELDLRLQPVEGLLEALGQPASTPS